ncbi:MAG: hypothetical protein JWO82_1559 [Akkermansiaceae bacterium]|nr:hypothetical protein [Akkermansiaceae bacterium]
MSSALAIPEETADATPTRGGTGQAIRCPTLAELPPPPPGRTGWPWTVETPQLPPLRPDGSPWPVITIVTPSFGQGPYIEECLRSVLLQGYPQVEYFVLDGGSTDETRLVLRKYEPWLATWVSEPDGGQTKALNRGFGLARGEFVGWQNSDDFYHPAAFRLVGEQAALHPDNDVFFGDKDYVDEQGGFLFTRNNEAPTFAAMIPWPSFNSESAFFRRSIFEGGWRLKEELRHYMDYEFFWRLFLDRKKFLKVAGLSASFRRHAGAKSSRQVDIAQAEAFEIYRFVHDHAGTPPEARRLLIEAMRIECLNDFGHYRFAVLRQHVATLVRTAGWRAVPAGLWVRVGASLAGPDVVRGLLDGRRRSIAPVDLVPPREEAGN